LKAYGGDPRDLKLSLLKEGYGKKAAAYVQHHWVLYLLLLGGAERLIDPSLPCTFPTQEHSMQNPIGGGGAQYEAQQFLQIARTHHLLCARLGEKSDQKPPSQLVKSEPSYLVRAMHQAAIPS
jgi:hypothetical protein